MNAATARLELPARLTLAEARAAAVDLGSRIAAAPAGDVLVLDAGALGQFDSSALAVLLECQRMARANGRAFAVQHLPPKLTELARLYGVDGLLQSA